MNRKRKVLVGMVFAAVIAVVASGFLWVPPTVDFRLNPDTYYQQVGDKWVTRDFHSKYTTYEPVIPVTCKNSGALSATFNITVSLSGASFLPNTALPYEQINGTTVKLVFTLGSFEEKTQEVHFLIGNSSGFTVSLTLEADQSPLRVVDAQKSSSEPWLRSYRELQFWNSSQGLVPAVIS